MLREGWENMDVVIEVNEIEYQEDFPKKYSPLYIKQNKV